MRGIMFMLFAACAGPGKILGKVTDAKTGEALVGVTVAVDAPSLPDDRRSTITNAEGSYQLAVPNGRQSVKLFWGAVTLQRVVDVGGSTVVDQQIDPGWTNSNVMQCTSGAATSCK